MSLDNTTNLYHIVRRQLDQNDQSFNDLKLLANSIISTINKTADQLLNTKEQFNTLAFEKMEPNKKLLQELENLMQIYKQEKEQFFLEMQQMNQTILELETYKSHYHLATNKLEESIKRVKELDNIVATERKLRKKAENKYFIIKEQIQKYSKTMLISSQDNAASSEIV